MDTSMIKHMQCAYLCVYTCIYTFTCVNTCIYVFIRTDHKYILRQIKLHPGWRVWTSSWRVGRYIWWCLIWIQISRRSLRCRRLDVEMLESGNMFGMSFFWWVVIDFEMRWQQHNLANNCSELGGLFPRNPGWRNEGPSNTAWTFFYCTQLHHNW